MQHSMMETHGHNILLEALLRHNISNMTTIEDKIIFSPFILNRNVFLLLLLLASFFSFLSFSRIYHYLQLRSCQVSKPPSSSSQCCLLIPQCWPCLSGGIFLALLFLDLFPAVNKSMAATGIDVDIFPIGQFIVVTSFLVVMFSEQAVMQWKERADQKEKHGGAKTLFSKCRKTFLSQNIIRSLFLVFSLSLHSCLEGISLGLTWSGSNLHRNIPTILQKSLISSCLGFSLARLSPSLVMFQCMVYLSTSLGGVVLGAAAGQRMEGEEMTLAVLHGTSAGIFLYILFFEILPHQLNGPGSRLGKVFFAMLGFLVAAGVVALI